MKRENKKRSFKIDHVARKQILVITMARGLELVISAVALWLQFATSCRIRFATKLQLKR